MTNKTGKLALLLALLITVCCVMLTACNNTASTSTADEAETTTAAATEAQTEAATGKAQLALIKESYAPAMAFDTEGNSVELTQVYGSSFVEYGGELCFKEDGTFTTFIGTYGNANNESGTYTIISASEIEMKFNNDTTEIAVVTATDVEGNAVEIRLYHRGFNVIFQ